MTNEDLDLLVERIIEIYKLKNQEDIMLAIKRNKGYISQIKSRKDISPKLIELLKLKFPKAFEDQPADYTKTELWAALKREQENVSKAHDTIRLLIEREQPPDMSKAQGA